MADRYDPSRDIAEMIVAGIFGRHDTVAYAGRVAERLGLDEDASVEAVRAALLKALGLKACLCAIDGPGAVLPFACPIHGVPCDDCGGLEGCTDDCGEADPAGTVADLASGEPRTVFRVRGCLLVPALRLDARGCALLRTIINGELPDLETVHAAGVYKVEGKDGFDLEADYYPLSEHPDYGSALAAARARLRELDRTQSGAGGQDGIQDRVYVVHPDGRRERVLS